MDIAWLLVLLSVPQVLQINASTYSEISSLYHTLTTGYNKYLRPQSDYSEAAHLYISMNILNLKEINAVEGTVTISVYFTLQWDDFNLKWTPSSFNNTEYVILPTDQVWKPPLINSNTAKEFSMFGNTNSYVIIHNSGIVTWQPGHQLEFSCNIDTTYFPFDTQKCTLDVIAWGYNMGDIYFTPTRSNIDTIHYVENSEWDMTFTSVVSEDGPPPTTKFTMHLKRRPLYLIINLIFPVILLALLNITVFLLPQDSGERVGFAITLLLSIVVFLTIAQGLLPATAQPRLSAVCIVLILNMVMSGMITVSVIVSGWIYYKPEDYDVPNWIQKVIRFKLYHRPTNTNQVHVINVQNEKTIDKPLFDGNESKVTWHMVAKYYDRISLIFYVICFVCGHVSYAIDIVKGE